MQLAYWLAYGRKGLQDRMLIETGILLWFDLQLDALNFCLFTYNTFINARSTNHQDLQY